ncbi:MULTISPECIES: metal-dependent hydrolase [Nocardia]|uniref:metal-dependent hydrolase n=1 Tax=Nocardia TaxID=1817 RepID=UPI000D68E5B6
MSDLEIRTLEFDLDGEIPFRWNDSNPAFSMQMNAVSIIAIGFEKFIVAAVREAIPLITDSEAKSEARAFLEQEAQHSMAHRRHLTALIRTYPGLQETLEGAIALFDELTATESLQFRLAYIADLEATFTPFFKLLLDHDDKLFRPGDDRVASLLLWHFVEEVEHRSSGLIVYNAMVPSKTYRTRVLPRVVGHVAKVNAVIEDGFNRHVPASERGVDARVLHDAADRPLLWWQRLASRFPGVVKRPVGPLDVLPLGDKLISFTRILLSQTPGHDPVHQPLPAFAERWFAHYESGGDVAHWYSSTTGDGVGRSACAASGFHSLRISDVDRMTEDSIAVTFDIPAELRETFHFVQGQHVSVRTLIDGQDVRRTYSISTPPSSRTLRVGIKRTPGGLFSNWAVEQLRIGDRLEIAAPTGSFHVPLDPALVRHHVGIAGGSGIGPVLSVLAATLEQEPRSRFTLLYANRTADAVMFRTELGSLSTDFGDRLRVVHVHEDVDGFIDSPKLGAWLADGTLAEVDAWFVCGPNAMADAVNAALAANGVDLSLVHSESYTAGETRARPISETAARFADADLTFTVGGSARSVPVSGRTLLEAALSTGTVVPWSCRSGICGTCRAKLNDGTVEQAFDDVLSERERADGYILTCQSRPTSDRVSIDYGL